MNNPQKAATPPTINELMKMLDSECRKMGGEAIVFIYSTEEGTSVVPNPLLKEAEQKILIDKLLPAIFEAGREMEKLKRMN